jgi:hypothetical protein
MKPNDSQAPNQAPAPQSPATQPSTPPLTWLRLPDEPEDAYQDFLCYLRKSCNIAGILVEARALLNLEIVPYGDRFDLDVSQECFHWRERVPSFFAYLGTSLAERLAQEKAEYETPVVPVHIKAAVLTRLSEN